MDEISGGCSAEDVGKALDAAIADERRHDRAELRLAGRQRVRHPGAGDKIYAGRGKKRIIGLANHEAASAGYSGSCRSAAEIVVAPNGWVGSIGVLMMHYSDPGWEEKQGYQTTITRTPATKAEGAAGETLSKEALASRQEMVDQLYEKFTPPWPAAAAFRWRRSKRVWHGRMVMADEAVRAAWSIESPRWSSSSRSGRRGRAG
jgi:hypothetical protein